MLKSGVYKIVNLTNNKIYIGSSRDLGSRRSGHFCDLKNQVHHCVYLQRVYNKLTEEDFSFEVIEFCKEDLLIEREQYWIDLLKPEYNICQIASSTLGFHHSEEAKEKMSIRRKGKSYHSEFQLKRLSEVHTGKVLSGETKKKLSKVLKGRVAWNKGVKLTDSQKESMNLAWTEERKQKLRERMKGNSYRNKKEACYERE